MATYTGVSGKPVSNPKYNKYGNFAWTDTAPTSTAFQTAPAGPYSANPSPQTGTGAFGLVPGSIGLPDPYGDLSKVYPQMAGTQNAVGNFIQSEAQGQLSPETIANIKNAAATYGVSSGIPGSPMATNYGLYNTALGSQNLQRQGATDYQSILPTIFKTETVSPELQSAIAERNALYAAAPNPNVANRYSRYLQGQLAESAKGGGDFGSNLGSLLGGAAGAGLGLWAGGPKGGMAGFGIGSGIGGKAGSLIGS